MQHVSQPYDPLEPVSEAEAKTLARQFHSNLILKDRYSGRGAESNARRRCKDLGWEGVVVRGEGKYRGVFLVFRLDPIGYPKVGEYRKRKK